MGKGNDKTSVNGVNFSIIKKNHLVKSMFDGRVGKVVDLLDDNVNAIVKWCDGSTSNASIYSLLRIFTEKDTLSDPKNFAIYKQSKDDPYKSKNNVQDNLKKVNNELKNRLDGEE